MSDYDGDSLSGGGGGPRRSRNAVVDMTITIDELSGLMGQDDSMFLARWKRGASFHGETHWSKVINGTVSWKRTFTVSGVALPRQPAASNKKFIEFNFFKKAGMEESFGSVKVEVFFQNEKRKKASLQFTLAQPNDPNTVQRLKLIITVQMTETGGPAADKDSVPGSPGMPNGFGGEIINANRNPRKTDRFQLDGPADELAMDQGLRRPSLNTTTPAQYNYLPQQGQDADDLMPIGMGGPDASVDVMKLNVLKLYTKIQESESKLGEKKREIRELKSAFTNLRNDYEHLRSDLDNSEQRSQRLREDLTREQHMNRELMELKARLESFQRNGFEDTNNRGCDMGGCVVQ